MVFHCNAKMWVDLLFWNHSKPEIIKTIAKCHTCKATNCDVLSPDDAGGCGSGGDNGLTSATSGSLVERVYPWVTNIISNSIFP